MKTSPDTASKPSAIPVRSLARTPPSDVASSPTNVVPVQFVSRPDAGGLLATRLMHHAGKPNVLVLGLAPGGVPVACEVARQLRVPVDALVVRMLRLPYREELAMGSIAPGGVCILDDNLIDMLDIEIDTIDSLRLREEREMDRQEQLYRENREPPPIRGKTVIVVDEAIPTAWKMHAAIVYLHQQNAAHVIVAAPVMAQAADRELHSLAADVIYIILVEKLESVERWFEEFSPVTDDEVRKILNIAHAPRGARGTDVSLSAKGCGVNAK